MAVIKCKMCGGDLVIEPDSTVAECEYCGSRQTVPTADNEKKLTLFARANRLRAACEFDKAAGIYESIVADFPEEAEAYWGLVLCKYGIEYVDDPATGKKIPTCHRSGFDSVLEDGDFEQACENADAIARRVYREEAKQIEELRKGIIEVSGKEEPYDIFICYKETDENGARTIVAVSASDSHTVGLRSDGTVVAVGENDDGQCDISGWTDIVAVSAGDYHTVGLKSDGTVVAMGREKNGRCNVFGWRDIVAVSAGGGHTVGLKKDGTVVATGDNDCLQCNVYNWKLFNNLDILEQERKAEKARRVAELKRQKAALQTELAGLKGVFSGMWRSKVEAQLAQIEKELKGLK